MERWKSPGFKTIRSVLSSDTRRSRYAQITRSAVSCLRTVSDHAFCNPGAGKPITDYVSPPANGAGWSLRDKLVAHQTYRANQTRRFSVSATGPTTPCKRTALGATPNYDDSSTPLYTVFTEGDVGKFNYQLKYTRSDDPAGLQISPWHHIPLFSRYNAALPESAFSEQENGEIEDIPEEDATGKEDELFYNVSSLPDSIAAAVGVGLGEAFGSGLGQAIGTVLGHAAAPGLGAAVGPALGQTLGAGVGMTVGATLSGQLGLDESNDPEMLRAVETAAAGEKDIEDFILKKFLKLPHDEVERIIDELCPLPSESGLRREQLPLPSTDGNKTLRATSGDPNKFLQDQAENFPAMPPSLLRDLIRRPLNMIVEVPRLNTTKLEIATRIRGNPIVHDVNSTVINGGFTKYAVRHYKFPMLWNYGSLPQTWESPDVPDFRTGLSGDNDPLDVVEIGSLGPLPAGSIVPIKIIGCIGLVDEGSLDWKILALNIFEYAQVTRVAQHHFQHYHSSEHAITKESSNLSNALITSFLKTIEDEQWADEKYRSLLPRMRETASSLLYPVPRCLNAYNLINHIDCIYPHTLSGIREWFRWYKIPEGKAMNQFISDGRWFGPERAMLEILKAHLAWRKLLASGGRPGLWTPSVALDSHKTRCQKIF